MPTAPEWHKIRTLNLARMLQGKAKSQYDPEKNFAKRGRGQGHVTPNFWGDANSSKMTKHTNFKFGVPAASQSPDMTHENNSQKGARSGSRDPQYFGL